MTRCARMTFPGAGSDPVTPRWHTTCAPCSARGSRARVRRSRSSPSPPTTGSSLDAYDRRFGLPAAAVQDRPAPPPLGGAGDGGATGREEVDLDLEIIHAIAPRAQIIDYNAPFTDASGSRHPGDAARPGRRGRPGADRHRQLGYLRADDSRSRHRARRARDRGRRGPGDQHLQVTGDAGAYQCQRASEGDRRLSVEWPASSPGVIGVGGTSLAVSRRRLLPRRDRLGGRALAGWRGRRAERLLPPPGLAAGPGRGQPLLGRTAPGSGRLRRRGPG